MSRKHYAIGAAILTVGAVAAVVLLPKAQEGAGLGGIAYLPSGMTSPFSAPPTIKLPLAEIEAPVIPAQPKAPVKLAEVPTSAPVDIPPSVARTHRAQPPAETPTASDAPSDTPFAWHGRTGSAQSWKGTGGRAVALNDGPSAGGFSGGGGGGGGGSSLSASNHPLANPPSLPPSSTPSGKPKAPTLTNGNDSGTSMGFNNTLASAGGSGDTPSGGGGFHNGAGSSSAIVAPGGPNDGGGQGFIDGPAQYASYQAPDDTQQSAVTVDEPGALSILLVGALGLLVARRATKRNAA
jgi:hypothetical protein